jgi:hypothetical protein
MMGFMNGINFQQINEKAGEFLFTRQGFSELNKIFQQRGIPGAKPSWHKKGEGIISFTLL